MKRKSLYILFYLLPLLCLYACTQPYPESILRAESTIKEHPDRALAILDSIKESIKTESEQTRMYYGLLQIEAHERCYKPHPADSLIPAITRYYEKENDKEKLAKSYYYMGRRHFDLENTPAAFSYFLRALDASAKIKDYAFLGRIHSQIGHFLTHLNLRKEVIEEYKEAYSYYQLGGDSLTSAYALRDLAKAYDLLEKRDSALYYYQKAYELANKNKDKQKEITILRELATIYIQMNESNKALEILRRATVEWKKEKDSCYGIWGDLYLKMGKEDSAVFYFKKEIGSGDSHADKHAYWNLYSIEKKYGNYKQALAYFEKYVECSDNIYQSSKIESFQKIKSGYEFHTVKKEKAILSEENIQQRSWIIGIMIATAIAIGCLIQYIRIKKVAVREQNRKLRNIYEEQYRKSQQYIEDNKKEIDKLEKKINQVQQEKDELKQKLLYAQKEKLEQTNHIIEATQREQALLEETLRKTAIYVHCYRGIENPSIMLTDTDWKQLENAINEAYDGFTNRLFMLYPSISSMELRICLLLKIQIPVSTISQFVCRTQSAVSMSRKQLYKKIFKKEGTPTLLDQFIVTF